MRRIILGLAMAFSIVGRADAAIQWSMSDGGNDHWYELVLPGPNGQFWKWEEARIAAENDILLGMQGHLVTDTSAAEHAFLEQTFASQLLPFTDPTHLGDLVWIGLTDRVVEGEFRWVTGESLSYTAWFPGEPNNSGGTEGEDAVCFQVANNQTLGWNDGAMDPPWGHTYWNSWGYITEFEPAAVPEPASVAVWSVFGIIGIAVTYRRRRMLNK